MKTSSNMNSKAERRVLDFVSALASQIDPELDANSYIMERIVLIGRLVDWLANNPGQDITYHPDYIAYMGEFCDDCKGTLELRILGERQERVPYCGTCERFKLL